ncbi:MAG: hypothetical protein ACR2N7_08735 [Acidimicrobiia bacterium]
MKRKTFRGAKQKDGEVDESPVVFRGSIRSAEESDSLQVEVSMSDGNIILQTADTELGSWPLAEVQTRRIDSTTFDFIAEGDQLIFTPEDAEAFAVGPLVVRPEPESGRRKRSRAKKRASADQQAAAADAPEASTSAGEAVDAVPPAPKTASAATTKQSLRMRMLDAARHNSFFDLDRVPIDETLRGSEHQHSWEHRVATGSGLASRVCTICGKIRVSKSS